MNVLENFGINGKVLLWQVINFAILFLILSKFLYKPLARAVNLREAKVSSSLKRAKKERIKAERLEENLKLELKNQREKLEEEQKKSFKTQEELLKKARTRAEANLQKMIKDSRDQAERERGKILDSIESEIRKTAQKIASVILEREIRVEDDDRLVKEAVIGIKNEEAN